MRKFQEKPYLSITAIVMFLLGITFIFGDHSALAKVFFIILGIILIIKGLVKFQILRTSHIFNTKFNNYLQLGRAVLEIISGIIFLFYHHLILSIILGAIFILLPTIRILTSKQKRATLKAEIPNLILGLIILCYADVLYAVLFITLGIILILIAILVCIYIIKGPREKKGQERQVNEFIDIDYEEK